MLNLRSIVFVAAGTAALAAWWFWPHAPASRSPQRESGGTSSQDAVAERDAILRELANLRAQVSVLRRDAMQRAPAALAQHDPDDTNSSDVQVAEEVAPPAEEVERLQRAALDSLVWYEPRDPAWSPMAEQEIADAVAAIAPLVSSKVECSAEICRVHVLWRDLADRHDTLERLVDIVPWQQRGAMYTDPERPLEADIFVGRQGAAWPAI